MRLQAVDASTLGVRMEQPTPINIHKHDPEGVERLRGCIAESLQAPPADWDIWEWDDNERVRPTEADPYATSDTHSAAQNEKVWARHKPSVQADSAKGSTTRSTLVATQP